MSQRIAELERFAGVALVRRSTCSVRRTEAGQRLVDETRAPFERIAHSFAGVRDQAGFPKGLLRVPVPVALARQPPVPRLADFLQGNPEVRLQLELSDRLSSLATDGFDLAIRHAGTVPDTHVAWQLCDIGSMLVASHAYLERRGTPEAPEGLTAHDCLFYPRAQETPAWTLELRGSRRKGERITLAVNGPFAANNSEALRDPMAGLGIALLPDFSAQAALQAGKLVQVLPAWNPVGAFAERLYAIRPYSSHVPLAVSAFACARPGQPALPSSDQRAAIGSPASIAR